MLSCFLCLRVSCAVFSAVDIRSAPLKSVWRRITSYSLAHFKQDLAAANVELLTALIDLRVLTARKKRGGAVRKASRLMTKPHGSLADGNTANPEQRDSRPMFVPMEVSDRINAQVPGTPRIPWFLSENQTRRCRSSSHCSGNRQVSHRNVIRERKSKAEAIRLSLSRPQSERGAGNGSRTHLAPARMARRGDPSGVKKNHELGELRRRWLCFQTLTHPAHGRNVDPSAKEAHS